MSYWRSTIRRLMILTMYKPCSVEARSGKRSAAGFSAAASNTTSKSRWANDLNERKVTTTSQDIDGGDQGVADEGITVQIIAGSAVMRSGLAALIAADERFKVWGTLRSATEMTPEKPPDVIVAVLEERSTHEFDELMTTEAGVVTSTPAVVVLMSHWQPESVISLLRSAASSFLPITATGDEIIAALDAAYVGLVVLHRDSLDAFETDGPAEEPNHERVAFDREQLTESLTAREQQILSMMAEGLGNKEIAWQLKIS